MPIQPASQRFDPYKNFKVRLKYEGKYVFGGDKVSGLTSFSVPQFRAGDDPSASRKFPGRSRYPTITLERGVVLDQSFNSWANQVSNWGSNMGSEVSPANFRKDIYLELYDEAGRPLQTFKLLRCWVSGYKALPNLSGSSNAVAIEHIHIENEGFMLYPPSR